MGLNSVGIFSDKVESDVVAGVDPGEAVGEVESAVVLGGFEPSGNVGSKSKISSVELSAIPNVESALETLPVLIGTKFVPGLSICCIFCVSTSFFLSPPLPFGSESTTYTLTPITAQSNNTIISNVILRRFVRLPPRTLSTQPPKRLVFWLTKVLERSSSSNSCILA